MIVASVWVSAYCSRWASAFTLKIIVLLHA